MSRAEVESFEGMLQCTWLQIIQMQPIAVHVHPGLSLGRHVGSCWLVWQFLDVRVQTWLLYSSLDLPSWWQDDIAQWVMFLCGNIPRKKGWAGRNGFLLICLFNRKYKISQNTSEVFPLSLIRNRPHVHPSTSHC